MYCKLNQGGFQCRADRPGALGITKEPKTDVRFVIYDGTTRTYFKRIHYGSKWVENICEATRWRNKATAKLKVSSIASDRWYAMPNRGDTYKDLANFRASREFKVRVREAKLILQPLD